MGAAPAAPIRVSGAARNRPWRAAAWLGLVAVVLAMAYSLWWSWVESTLMGTGGPGLSQTAFRAPGDSWCLFSAAGYVGNGALGYVYESCSGTMALPLMAVLLAPGATLGQFLGLTAPPAPQPTLWLLLGPVGLLTVIPLLVTVRSALPADATLRAVRVQLAALVVVFVPVAAMYGHFEDVLALALLCGAVALVRDGRAGWSALLVGLAIASKQWALLALPTLLAVQPPRRWPAYLVRALWLPGLLAAFLLAVDPAHAVRALLHPPTFPKFGHPALWTDAAAAEVSTVPLRAAAIVVAVLVAVPVLRRGGYGRLLAALGLALLARPAFEPVVHSYYLAPGLCLLLLHERVSRGTVHRTLVVGGTLLAWFGWHGRPWVFWAVAGFLGAIVAAPACRELFGHGVQKVQVEPVAGDKSSSSAFEPLTRKVGIPSVRSFRQRQPGDGTLGFSLVELMVIVTIIAILIAIAVPVFLGARGSAQDTDAMNLLGVAVKAERLYRQDHPSYTTDQDALRKEAGPNLSYVSTTPTSGADEVKVELGSISASTDDVEQIVCLAAVSESGRTFTIKDMSRGANAGTWYYRGADTGCDATVTNYKRAWN